MPADFPNNPVVGDTFTGSNGATYTWDGVKWVNTGCGTGALDNLIAGTCITLPTSGGNVFVNASVPCIQTPWLQSENASGFQLTNASLVQTPAVSAPPSNALTLSGSNFIALTVDSSSPILVSPSSVVVNYFLQLGASAVGSYPGLRFADSSNYAWLLQQDSASVTTEAFRLFYQTPTPSALEVMTWLPNGNVGIGTSAPAVALDVHGSWTSGGVSGPVRFTGTGGACYVSLNTVAPNGGSGITFSSANVYLGEISSWSTDILTIYSSGAAAAINVAASGYVGIGISSPIAARLHVAGNIFVDPESTGGASGGMEITASSSWAQINSFGAQPLILAPNGGNVGVGSGLPGCALDVNGLARITNLGTIPPSGDGVEIYYSTVSGGFVQCVSRPTGTPLGLTLYAESIMFDAGGPERMRITPNGFVGIGDTSPLGILDVVSSAGGAISYQYFNGNVIGQLPTAFGSRHFALGWNYTNGTGEIDFFNCSSALGGFRFYQMTSASAATYLGGFNAQGDFFANSVEIAGAYFGPTKTSSGPMLFCSTADGTPNMDPETIMFWADQNNNQIVLAFRTGGGSILHGYIPIG